MVTVLAVLLVACGGSADPPLGVEVSTDSGTYNEITVAELNPLLDDPQFVVVNTHVPFEGDIPGTDLSIPFDQIEANLDQLPDPQAKVVVYCKGEGMSTIAAETLTQLGYTSVYKVDGGMVAWEEAGYTLDQ
jgi:rhodanese-related sulfurtransferase